MSRFGDLTQTMCVYELEIDVTNVDYKELGKQLEPKDNIVAINSNFVHKALTGYEEYILKPKKRRVELKTNRYGDCTVFNASIEFTIIVDDEQHVRNIRFFPRAGKLQLYGVYPSNVPEPTSLFIEYLHACGVPAYENVRIISDDKKALLLNYKFVINIGEGRIIKITHVRADLNSDNHKLREMSPFPIRYVTDNIAFTNNKVSIKFGTNEKGIRVIIWPNYGKVNIFGCKTELSASLLYDFICDIFNKRWDHFVVDLPKRDK